MESFDPFYHQRMQRDWAACHQGEGEPITYFIMRAAAFLPDLYPTESETSKVNLILQKVNFTYKWNLVGAKCQSLTQLMDHGRTLQFQYDEAMHYRQQDKPKVWAEPSLASSEERHGAAGESKQGGHTSRTSYTPHSRLSTTKSPKPNIMRCSVCERSGHIARDCRQPAYFQHMEETTPIISAVPKN
jgi:hypothetical protein